MLFPDEVKLLYIEDDESNAKVVEEILKKDQQTKFTIVRKCTLKEALEFLKTECIDIDTCEVDAILLDLILPNSQGVNTYKKVLESCDFIPVVITSGHEDIALDCVKLGAQDYLLKQNLTSGVVSRALKYAIERVRIQRCKLELESKYRQVINSTPVGFHTYELIDGQLFFKEGNPAADKILGVDNSQFVGKTIEEAFPNLIDTNVPEKYMEVVKTGEPWSGGIIEYEDSNVRKGYYRVNAFKSCPGCVTASFEDVTQQILSEQRYKDLVEVTKAAMLKLDFKKNKFVYANDVACKQFGYTKEELLETSLEELLTNDSLKDWHKRREALKNGEFIDNSFEYEVIRKDGKTIWGLITSEYLEDEDGIVNSANIVAIDITDRKLAEKEAKEKEVFIFNELETRIQEWRTELDQGAINHKTQIQLVDMSSEVN